MNKKLLTALGEIEPVRASALSEAELDRLTEKISVKKRGSRPAFRAVLKTAAACAAVFLLFVGVGVANPVFAENIPVLSNIVTFLRGHSPWNTAVGPGVTEHMVPTESSDGVFTVRDAYYDGTFAAMTLSATVPGIDPGARALSVEVRLAADGTPVSAVPSGTVEMLRAEGDTFLGALTADVTAAAPGERFTLTVTPESVKAIDPFYRILNTAKGAYEAKSFRMPGTLPEITAEIALSAEQQVYEVNAALGGVCTVRSVSVTPASTRADIDQLEGGLDGAVLTVTDDKGEELPFRGYGEDGACYFDPLLKDVRSLTFSLVKKIDATVIDSVTVPIKGGYIEPDDLDALWADYASEETVYDPPMPTLPPSKLPYKTEPFGTTVAASERSAAPVEDGGRLEITCSNLQVWADHTEAGIDDGDLSGLSLPWEQGEPKENYRFVTFDLHLENEGTEGPFASLDDELQEEAALYEGNDGTASVYWITELADVVSARDAFFTDLYYFSAHGNGLSNYYHFAMNRRDTRDVTVGFYLPKDLLENGELALLVGGHYVELPHCTE